MINFNIPPYVGTELNYVQQAIAAHKDAAMAAYTRRLNEFLDPGVKF